MDKIIVIANQKGGVGRTTTAVNLTVALDVLKKKILFIDANSQSNTISGLALDMKNTQEHTYEAFENKIPLQGNVRRETEASSVFVFSSHLDAVQSLKNDYDYIIIDCVSLLGLIRLNVLKVIDSVIIPIQCEYFTLEDLIRLLNTIKSLQQTQPDPAYRRLIDHNARSVAATVHLSHQENQNSFPGNGFGDSRTKKHDAQQNVNLRKIDHYNTKWKAKAA